jgi:hypothetical protein
MVKRVFYWLIRAGLWASSLAWLDLCAAAGADEELVGDLLQVGFESYEQDKYERSLS